MQEKKSFLMMEIELLLAEKQTSLATLRTGIAVFTLPFTVLTILIATSSYYEVGTGRVMWMFIALLALCTALVLFGAYLVVHSARKIRAMDEKIEEIKKRNRFIDNLMVD